MKIAIISYEHPVFKPWSGGIGTYTVQTARIMADRGHHVEIFCGTHDEDQIMDDKGVIVNAVSAKNVSEFNSKALSYAFNKRHALQNFDVVEGADFWASGLSLVQQQTGLPFLLKLHTPSFLTKMISGEKKVSFYKKARYMTSGLAKGKWNKPFWIYDYLSDREYQLTVAADKVISCSGDLVRILTEKWKLTHGNIEVIPNAFVPKNDFLNIQATTLRDKVNIAYVGTVEKRKGLIYLAKAFVSLAKHYPYLRLEVIGKIPEDNQNDYQEVKQVIRDYSDRVTFHGLVKNSELPTYLMRQDICVLPSIWENFPYTCLEAMSAARAVIGSNAGGMSEMIDHGESGLLVPPKDALAIENAIRFLLDHPEKTSYLGNRAREKVLQAYNADVIGTRMENAYTEAIENHKKKLPSTV